MLLKDLKDNTDVSMGGSLKFAGKKYGYDGEYIAFKQDNSEYSHKQVSVHGG